MNFFVRQPEPLFKDGRRLDFSSPEEVAVLGALRDWQAAASTDDVVVAMAELDKIRLWLNLPQYLLEAVPIHHVRRVIERLSTRCT